MKTSVLQAFLALLSCKSVVNGFKKDTVKEIFHWKNVTFENLPFDENAFIGKYPYYIPSNNDILGIDYHANIQIMFATVARVRPGVPSTLNAFCTSENFGYEATSPSVWGFPDYKRNTLKPSFYGSTSYGIQKWQERIFTSPNEDFRIISVYKPCVDNRCNRLFVIDTGVLHYSTYEVYNVQNPALIVFELRSNSCKSRHFPVIRRAEIPKHLWRNPVGFVYITVDFQAKQTCDDVFIYITNAFDNTITVYDYKKESFWTFSDPSMRPIIGESVKLFGNAFHYKLPLGIMNLALGYPDKNGHRNAYFSPGSSFAEYIVSTKLLKNAKRAPNKNTSGLFTLIGYRGCKSQSMRQIIDLSTGVMFFAEMQSKKVRCWNIQNPINSDTIDVIHESDDLQFVSHVTLDAKGYLWILANHLPIIYLTDIPLNTTNTNSRLFRVKASKAIKGTVCDVV